MLFIEIIFNEIIDSFEEDWKVFLEETNVCETLKDYILIRSAWHVFLSHKVALLSLSEISLVCA